MTRRIHLLGVALALFAGATTAPATAPVDRPQGEVPVSQGMIAPSYRQLDAREAARLLPGWDNFTGARGQGWMVIQYRDDLKTPTSIVGPGIPLVGERAGSQEVDRAVRDFVAAQAGILRVDPAGLGDPEIVPLDRTRTEVVLPQVYRGLPVVDARVELYLDAGRVVMMGSQFYSGLTLGVVPALSAPQSQAAAVSGVSYSAASDSFDGDPRLVVYPMILDGTPQPFLAWEVKFRTASPVGWWWAYVDAGDGTVLARTNHASTFDIPTTVHSNVHLNYAFDPQTEIPSPDHWVQADTAIAYTDADGLVSVPVPTADSASTVSSMIRGRYARVRRYTGEGSDAAWSGPGTPGTPLAITWDDSNSLQSERDAYYSINRVHLWLKVHDPDFTLLDMPLPAYVNRTDGTCNAYWDGASVNFYKEGGGCVNMATISDVVMHEYGHGITQKTYQPYSPPTNSGMGEALSDIVAQTITNDHLVGRGWHNGTGYVRDADNTRQYPGTSCGGEVHCLGEILMGAMWKTRTNMLNSMGAGPGLEYYDALMRFAWKTRQSTMPDYLTKVLLGDDDNGNVADGTPHWDDICSAFAVHNLPCPAITQYLVLNHNPLADQGSTQSPYLVTADVVPINCGDVVPDSVRVIYSTDSGTSWNPVLLTPNGVPGQYEAEIPPQACGTVVSYYLRAASTTGVSAVLPAHAPTGGTYRFMCGPRVAVQVSDCETDQGWTVGAPGDGATEGLWERVDPVGKTYSGEVYQPEDDHTADPGALCFVTDGRGGSYLNYDVDGGATTVLSPIFDLSTAAGACKLEFWAFFQNTLVVNDTLRASVSNDAGSTWTDLVTIAGSGLNAWNIYKGYFTDDQVPYTNQMRFRFQVADYDESETEAAVDDIVIRRTNCPSTTDVAAEAAPLRFTVEAARPNPTSTGSSVRFALPVAGVVDIDLFDAGGRVVRTLAGGPLAAGYHHVEWDGNDATGRPVASGVYYYQVRADGRGETRKVLVVR